MEKIPFEGVQSEGVQFDGVRSEGVRSEGVPFWINRCCRRLNVGLFLQIAAEWLAISFCLLGTFLLIVKRFQPVWWPYSLWVGIAIFPVLFFAWRRSQRQPHTTSDAAALLDRQLQTGGLLLALVDSSVNHSPTTTSAANQQRINWENELPFQRADWKNALPRIRPVRFARLILLPLLFLLGVCLIPLHRAETNHTQTFQRPQVTAVEELPQLLETVKNAGAVSEQEAEYLETEIQRIVNATKKAPLTRKDWEQIDTLRTRLQNRLEERAHTVVKAQQMLQQFTEKNGTKNSDQQVAKISPQEQQQLQAVLSKVLKANQHAERSKQHSQKSSTQSSPSVASKMFSPDFLSKVISSDLLKNIPPGMIQQIEKQLLSGKFSLPENPMLRKVLLQQAAKLLQQDGQQLSKLFNEFQKRQLNSKNFQSSNPQLSSLQQLAAIAQKNPQINGQPSTGGGPLPNQPTPNQPTPNQPTPEKNSVATHFRNIVLPPNFLNDPKGAITGTNARQPKVLPRIPTPETDSSFKKNALGGTAWKRRYRPHQREFIKRYFQSQAKKQSE